MRRYIGVLFILFMTTSLYSQTGEIIKKVTSSNYETAKFSLNESFEDYISKQVNERCNCSCRYKVGVMIDSTGKISSASILRSFGDNKDVIKCQDTLKNALINSPLWIPAFYIKENKKYYCNINKQFFIQLTN